MNLFKLFTLFSDGKDVSKEAWYGLWIPSKLFAVLHSAIDGRFAFYEDEYISNAAVT